MTYSDCVRDFIFFRFLYVFAKQYFERSIEVFFNVNSKERLYYCYIYIISENEF